MKSPVTVYLAAKLRHAPTMRAWYHELLDSPEFDVVSTWHNSDTLEADERDSNLCREGWEANIEQVEDAKYMIAFATKDDNIQGTLIEIGAAISRGAEIYLVGDYPWGSWIHMNNVFDAPTIHAALCEIAMEHVPLPARESLLNDPT